MPIQMPIQVLPKSFKSFPKIFAILDTFDPYDERDASNETAVINPGSFAKSGFSFKVYYPATGAIEDCQVPGDI